ncbi:hypothetical protein HGA91_03920 [candidate division WWE3 bacterium]|nr:hypothetical protein [candidate division WWE3 bacterium]
MDTEQRKPQGLFKLPPTSSYHDLPIFISLLTVMAFLAIGFSFPIGDNLFGFLFPKPQSHAAQSGTALKDNTIAIPLVIDAPRAFKTAKFTVVAQNGSIVGVTCGLGTYTGTESNNATCTVEDSQLSTTTGQRTVGYVSVNGTGALGAVLKITGSNVEVKDINNAVITGASLVESNYTIASTLPINQRVYFPLQFHSSTRITAAEFSPVLSSSMTATGRAITCGGDGFVDSGVSSSTRCVIFYPVTDADRTNGTVGSTGGVVGIFTFTPTVTGTFTVDMQNIKLSDANGTATAATFAQINATVANVSSVSPTAATTPTSTPTPTATPTPTSAPVDGGLSADQISATSPTFDSNVTVSGTKPQGVSVVLIMNDGNEIVVESNTGATTWSTTQTLGLGENTLVFKTKEGSTVKNTITISINRYGLGDINSSGRVDVFDLGIFSGNYGTALQQSTTSTQRLSDMKKDQQIDVFDLGVFAGVYGNTYAYDGSAPTPTLTPTGSPSRTPTPTPSATPTPTAAVANQMILYSDSIASGGDNWSWNSTINVSNTSPSRSGNSVAVTHNQAWGGFYLRFSNGIDLAEYDRIRFYIHGGSTGSQNIVFELYDEAGEPIDSIEITPPQAQTWQMVEITLSDLGSPSKAWGFVWQDNSGGSLPQYYLDDIMLVKGN